MRASGYARAANDWYVEPEWAVDALCSAEVMEGGWWDPACGSGNIPKALIKNGVRCWGSDIADRGFGVTGEDFFKTTLQEDNIVSNPPYGVLQEFVERALAKTTGRVIILARLAFLEGQARQPFFCRRHWLGFGLAVGVCLCRRAAPMLKPAAGRLLMLGMFGSTDLLGTLL